MARHAMTRAPALWDVVQAFYAGPGVSAACLTLQDQHGADVTLLLFLLARAERGQSFDAEEIARLSAATQSWRTTTIAPLRALRRQLKLPLHGFDAGTLRQMIATAEIEAERLQLIHLDSLIATSPDRSALDAAKTSIRAYAAHAGVPATALRPLLALFEAATEDQPIDDQPN
jgi:uncharacterized protein (TIGR02444 family)